MKAAVSHYEQLIKILKDPEEASAYLNAALEAGDKKAFLLALKNVLDAHGGMTKISDRTKINRVSLYKIFSSQGNPEFGTLLIIFKTLGVKLELAPNKTQRKKSSSLKKAA